MTLSCAISWNHLLFGLTWQTFYVVTQVGPTRRPGSSPLLFNTILRRRYLGISMHIGPLAVTASFPISKERPAPLVETLPSENPFTRILPR